MLLMEAVFHTSYVAKSWGIALVLIFGGQVGNHLLTFVAGMSDF